MNVTLIHVGTEEHVRMVSTHITVDVRKDSWVTTVKQVGYLHYQNICPN